MANSIGRIFRITSFGESHGPAVGVIIDGCPAGVQIDEQEIQRALNRRRPGQSQWVSPRNEKDLVEICSGVDRGRTLGSPLSFRVTNTNVRPQDYSDMKEIYRPSHADWTTELKWGIRSRSGGGRSSARETIARVIAGSIAEQILKQVSPATETLAYVSSIGQEKAIVDETRLTRADIEKHPLRCPDTQDLSRFTSLISRVKAEGDTIGGTIRCLVRNPPQGLGAPVFGKLHADLAQAILTIPAAKAFELGSGFDGCQSTGSEQNDAFIRREGQVRTQSNHSGGIQGGISNGENIRLRVGFKPVSTIFKCQDSINNKGQPVAFKPENGRHDPCVLPRAVPIVEAMANIVLVDHYLLHRTSQL